MNKMSSQYHRVVGYSATLVLHTANSVAMMLALQSDVMKDPDPDLKRFAAMQYRYITIWNLAFQLAYAGLSLACELYDIFKISKYLELRKMAEVIRNRFFCGVLWPFSVGIFTYFWVVYTYDRELIFPSYIDKVLSQASNHVMHTAILAVVLWELTYNPRKPPKSHGANLKILSQVYWVYIAVIVYTHWQFAEWPYPLLNYLNSYLQSLFSVGLYGLTGYIYFLQWSLTPIMSNLLVFTYWQLAGWPYPFLSYLNSSQLAIVFLAMWALTWCIYYLQWRLTPIMCNLLKKKVE